MEGRGRVFSIGHGALSIAALIEQLEHLTIPFLIDVRSAPYSRHQPEFSRDVLSEHLRRRAIRYVFMGDQLGGRPSDPDCYDSDGRVDYRRCCTKPFFIHGIGRLCLAHTKGIRVCLLCSEGKPWECHRSKLIGCALQEHNITVEHVLPGGSILTQGQVIDKITSSQRELFGAAFKSRKVYI